jgi:uncharacterized membrane protein YccC
MTTATLPRPLSFAGAPLSGWTFGIRIWVAVVVALAASFWMELEAPSTAALTVAILAAPTRGEALHKAGYRLIATVIGVVAALAIAGLFSQSRDLLIAAFAGWIGLCVYAAGLADGNRAYAAVLSGYTWRSSPCSRWTRPTMCSKPGWRAAPGSRSESSLSPW